LKENATKTLNLQNSPIKLTEYQLLVQLGAFVIWWHYYSIFWDGKTLMVE